MKYVMNIRLDSKEELFAGIPEEIAVDWFEEHKEEFEANVNEYVRNELKYFMRELYPIRD